MKSISSFQLIAIGLCVVFVIAGVGIFAAFGGLLGGTSVGAVTIWGTADANTVNGVLTTLRQQDRSFSAVQYVQKDAATYDATLLNAMASGQGPDLFLIGQSDVLQFSNKITPIPFSAVSQGAFTGSYIDAGNIFLTQQGSLALPFSIDPLVMYWNNDLFASAGLAQAPQYWNDFLTIAPKITSLDQTHAVNKSAVALGEWSNVTNAKAILSALFMQAGDPIVSRNDQGAAVPVFGATPQGAPENPAESALRFYTEFADPSKTSYSWNASLPQSNLAFSSGTTAVYFGFASEYPAIAARNPNLHFSVALLPQLQGNATHLTFANITGLAISRSAKNPQGALIIAQKLTSQQAVSLLAQATGMPPVRRDVVLDTSSSAAAAVFVQSSLISRSWLDPNSSASDTAFKTMIESVVSGAQLPQGAVSEGAQALGKEFNP